MSAVRRLLRSAPGRLQAVAQGRIDAGFERVGLSVFFQYGLQATYDLLSELTRRASRGYATAQECLGGAVQPDGDNDETGAIDDEAALESGAIATPPPQIIAFLK